MANEAESDGPGYYWEWRNDNNSQVAALMQAAERELVFAVASDIRLAMDHVGAQVSARLNDRYPHICPRCNGPAYVGAVEVDCAGGCK